MLQFYLMLLKLNKHLKQEHKKLQQGKKLKEIIYGGVDGIITTFAVVAGFSGALFITEESLFLGVSIVLLFGFANLFADGFSMGISDFLSSRAEKKFYNQERKKEENHIKNNLKEEEEITDEILKSEGFEKSDRKILIKLYKKNKKYWLDFMMRYELNLEKPEENSIPGAFITFLSFVSFGFLPLLPFLFLEKNQFLYACVIGSIELIFLGFFRAFLSGEKYWKAIIEILLLGVVAISIAYFVGTFFVI